MTAEKAYELGLINDVVTSEELDTCVESWVQDILKCAPLSTRAIKEAALKSATLHLEKAFTTEYTWENLRKDIEG